MDGRRDDPPHRHNLTSHQIDPRRACCVWEIQFLLLRNQRVNPPSSPPGLFFPRSLPRDTRRGTENMLSRVSLIIFVVVLRAGRYQPVANNRNNVIKFIYSPCRYINLFYRPYVFNISLCRGFALPVSHRGRVWLWVECDSLLLYSTLATRGKSHWCYHYTTVEVVRPGGSTGGKRIPVSDSWQSGW